MYSLASAVGLGLIVWGYGMARAEPLALWSTPSWARHAAALLTLPAFILLVAAYVPGNRIKAAIGHPMVAGVKLWALAHLLANGSLADLLLFGGFLAWAVASFAAARAAATGDGGQNLRRAGLAARCGGRRHRHRWCGRASPSGVTPG
jgi:uncharacterized membrane protein